MGDQVLHPRARTSVPAHGHLSQFFSETPEEPPWPSPGSLRTGIPGAHRLMRLAVAGGVVAAGLCLVLGMLVLVVTVGSSGGVPAEPDSAAGSVRQVSNVHRTGSPHPSHRPREVHGALTPAGRTIAAFHGANQPAHADFKVSSPGTWGLQWAFACRDGRSDPSGRDGGSGQAGRTGSLVVTEIGRASRDNVEIDASGRTGRGATWAFRDAGDHSLAIVSNCSWSIRIVRPADAGR